MTLSFWRAFIALFASLTFYPLFTTGQSFHSESATAPPDLSKWDLICYCVTSVNTPHFAVRADTNGQILYYAQDGATKAQLEQAMGAPVLSSQLGLLRDWRLLKRDGDVYTASIPVLGPEKIGRLRQEMGDLASRIAPEVRPDIEKIASELKRRNLSDHLYAVLFSYVLDGLTWDHLQSSKAVLALSDLQITAEHPFWEGTFWALYPKRDTAPGTNSTGPEGITLLMTWTEPVLKQLGALQNAPTLASVLQRAATGDCRHLSVEDTSHNTWNLDLPDGSCAVPVIHDEASDPVYAAGTRIAERIANAVLDYNAQSLIGGVTAQQAHLIETHELILELLDAFVRQKLVEQPAVLRTGADTRGALLPVLVVSVQKK
jgi:hypothetical protein